MYKCRACGNKLFYSESKFESGCGWPSFDNQVSPDAITTIRDTTHGMIRTEIRCGRCDSHLGHVFDDGPTETGLRYCVNSVSIDFDPKSE
jgi:peptide-methionine (R)-S-oxide reductase